MGSKRNFIELNGKQYDVSSGRMQPIDSSSQTLTYAKHSKSHVNHHGSIDGITNVQHKSAHPPAKPAGRIHHKTTHSKTLMRGAVHRPPVTAIQGAFEHQAHVRAHAYREIDSKREARAKNISKSHLVRKFATVDEEIKPKVVPLAVKAHPKPDKKAHATVAHPEPVIAISTPVNEVFEREALDQAESHNEPMAHKNHRVKKSRPKRRVFKFAASTIVLLLIASFFVYQNLPNFSLRMASAKAGVGARLPSYQPAGFTLSRDIHYESGQVSLVYHSNTDKRSFEVKQTTSAWNSDALAANLTDHNIQYIRQEDKGKTIFFYNESDAAWVNGGTLYQISGDSSLTSDQLKQLADSI